MEAFPEKSELDEYGMMDSFSFHFPDRHVQEGLTIALDGPGAFRRFKNTLRRFNIEDDWYEYKEMVLLDFARRWCEENDIPYYIEGTK